MTQTLALRALIIRHGEIPVAQDIDNTLPAFQKVVGGHVEVVDLGAGLALWCNENAIAEGLPVNRGVAARDVVAENRFAPAQLKEAPPAEERILWIRGDFFVTRADADGDAHSVTDADVAALARRLVTVRS